MIPFRENLEGNAERHRSRFRPCGLQQRTNSITVAFVRLLSPSMNDIVHYKDE